MKTERELLAERDAFLTQARDLNTLAETEKREFTAEEQVTWDKLEADITAKDKAIARSRILGVIPPQRPSGAPNLLTSQRGDTFAGALKAYLQNNDISEGLRGLMTSEGVEIRASNATDMNEGTAADGLNTVPTGLYNAVIAKRTEASLPEKLGVRRIPGKGITVNVPYDNEADGEFVAALEAGAFDNDAPALGQAAMTLLKYSKYIYLSDGAARRRGCQPDGLPDRLDCPRAGQDNEPATAGRGGCNRHVLKNHRQPHGDRCRGTGSRGLQRHDRRLPGRCRIGGLGDASEHLRGDQIHHRQPTPVRRFCRRETPGARISGVFQQ